jgi:hypothetical protein
MLQLVLAQVHYQPDSWKDHAHTDYVQAEFGQMFQLKYVNKYLIKKKILIKIFVISGLFSRRTFKSIYNTDYFMFSISTKIFTNY